MCRSAFRPGPAWLCCVMLYAVPAGAADAPADHGSAAAAQATSAHVASAGGKVAGKAAPGDATGGAGNADVKYDRTGDGLVDAEDWAKMSEDEKRAYARDSLIELGLAPDAAAGNGRTRLQDYLDGLRSVYGK